MTMPNSKRLEGRVALVAGATRGGGRGIARALGEAGATVYCTGRSTRGRARPSGTPGSPFELEYRSETIEETAELVTAAGGRGIAVQVDHTQADAVRDLVARIARESGRLDVLVNDIWGAEALVEGGKPFWELDPERAFAVITSALSAHLITSRFAVPQMVTARRGLVIEVTDGDGLYYRSHLAYDLAKVALIRMAFDMSEELAPHGVTALALTPGFIRSEAMLELFGVTEANWRDGVATDPHFAFSETPLYLGRAVVALATDAGVARHTGRALSTWTLQREYGFVDADGTAPDWGAHARVESFGRDQSASQQRFFQGFLEPFGRRTPAGWPRVSSSVFYDDAARAIDWLCSAFGFEVRLKIEGAGGRIEHSELTAGEGLIMIGSTGGKSDRPGGLPSQSPRSLGGVNTQMICVVVDDVDAHAAHARSAGAIIHEGPTTNDYGEEYWADRSYRAEDPEGHQWFFMQRVREKGQRAGS